MSKLFEFNYKGEQYKLFTISYLNSKNVLKTKEIKATSLALAKEKIKGTFVELLDIKNYLKPNY